ncbi:ABC transporter permease [Cytobacillus purgationiresistens]|uniref:ABC-2 type transport system permease protein n=1 Tax=Cytobacillus purgationiresistens TaxID=863449 RepID=A0ABU0AHM6_9BACI|nr:ABC transporter permease [Cytobacillus purgationiresistens]MDQ0269570.1 ABC-2 type transport system permease protein [Cytobacillus purgationiresistens]
MFNLIQNEWLKIFKKSGTYVMVGLLLLIITIAGAFMKYQDTRASVPDNESWKKGLEMQNQSYQKELEESGDMMPAAVKVSYEESIAINEYRIENNLSPNQDYSGLSFVSDMSSLIDFVGLFVIIIAGGIVASEFNWGTIKLLLIRPIKREKILASKYITVLLFGGSLLGLLFLYSGLLGLILFGTADQPVPHLNYQDGMVTEQNLFLYLMKGYGLSSINMLMLATMAFMISAAFRSNSLAIGLSIFLMFAGGQITQLVAMKYEWAKFSLFANTNLLQYFEGTPMLPGMTLGFSIIMLIIYFILFQAIAFFVFKKRDVTA